MGVIAFCGQKGGVGKSTAAICVASELHRRGLRVCLVDGDPQGSVSVWADKASKLGRQVPPVVALGARMHIPEQFAVAADGRDHVIIDCPGHLDPVQRSALLVADLAVIPCGPSGLDAWALQESVDTVRQAAELRADGLRACVLVSRKQVGTALHADARKFFASWGLPVLRTELCSRIAYQEALTVGRGVTDVAAHSAAGREVSKLTDELLKELSAHGQEKVPTHPRRQAQASRAPRPRARR